MDNLISRQAAIDAIVNTATDVYSHDRIISALDGAAFRQNEIIDIIEALPSAQRWIPCSERLPERGKDVLVTRDYDGREDCNKSCRYVEIASCYGEDDDPDWASFSDEYKMHPKNHHVIAWRELPEPYSGRGKHE